MDLFTLLNAEFKDKTAHKMHILKDAYAFASNREIRNLAIYKF
jgi:hypothetical protein